MSDLVFVRRAADEEKGTEAGPAVGCDAETAKGLLLDPTFEKCKAGDGWAKAAPKAR